MQIPGLVIEHAVHQAADGLGRRFVGSGGSSDELAKTIDAELLAARGSCLDDVVGVEHNAITRLERRFRDNAVDERGELSPTAFGGSIKRTRNVHAQPSLPRARR